MMKAQYGSQPIRNELTGIAVDFSDLGNLLKKIKMKSKFPKGFNKKSLREQEQWLVAEIKGHHDEVDLLRKKLSTVRGGNKIKIDEEIDRPDLALMKD
jgi:hypothetical protein